jgi:ATP-dependent Clp protease ATP-binding subunit ClpC
VNLTIPLYIETRKTPERTQEFVVRPLFFPHPLRKHEKLERAMHLIALDLRLELAELGKQPRHDELARWTFGPNVEPHRLDVKVELRKRTARLRLMFVTFEALGRRLAFSPAVPEAWFELARGENLQTRAAEVLTNHFRDKERQEEEDFTDPETLSLDGTAWVTPLTIEIHPAQVLAPPPTIRFAFLGESAPVDGEVELRRVGRCLDQLYPDDLDRVLLRDREVDELTRLLRGSERRPVLLLGPPLVGKTALLHEYVHRTVATRKDPYKVHNNVWLLSPQRLISGMSFVGQWENRLLAILKEAKLRDHILYFDDVLGLYQAGRTSQSDLSVAHVLKPYVERREVRLVAEMTPEALRVLRERDRGFADLFHILPIREPAEVETLHILVGVCRQLEGQHRVRFRIDVLPTVLDLQRRYVRHLSFPGKAAVFLRRLAVKHRGEDVSRGTALMEFHEQSGLTLTMLDGNRKLERAAVLSSLRQDVVGQRPALEAAADVIGVAKARLNDPGRPLGSLLFLGPTGVGKTQCAKAIARYLFSDSDSLLRFDMNEYLSPGAASRLAGTFDQPEGLLTAAVRRQPFAVVLLDEIEKAHPEVLDLLLQVLGEGRLTDALGRTVDFSNTLIVMTSNLGVREARQSLGFRAASHQREAYTLAAQKFFRPEFFNRLDRIVPFDPLTRAEVGEIARHLIHEVLHREGLVRRKCVLRLEESALGRIIDQGFDPVMGARALKRGIERQLTQPVAARLAAGVPETITVVNVYPLLDSITVDVQGLSEVQRLQEDEGKHVDPEATVRAVLAALRRIEERFSALRPEGEITAASLAGEQLFYFVIQEQVRRLREMARELLDVLEESRRPTQASPSLPVRGVGRVSAKRRLGLGRGLLTRSLLAGMAAADDVNLYLEELAAQAVHFGESDQGRLRGLVESTALLEVLAEASDRPAGEQVLLYLWTANVAGQTYVDQLAELYKGRGFVRGVAAGDEEYGTDTSWWALEETWVGAPPFSEARLEFARLFDPEMTTPEEEVAALKQTWRALLVRGLAAERLTAGEVGTHLFCPEHAGVVPVQVHAWPLPENTDPLAFVKEKQEERRRWLAGLERGAAALEADPLRMAPVVRIYNEGRHTIDLRTALVERGMPHVPALVLASLPVSPEVRAVE